MAILGIISYQETNKRLENQTFEQKRLDRKLKRYNRLAKIAESLKYE